MNFMNKLERKLGRHAIPNLMVWLIGGYALGYILQFAAPNVLSLMTLEPYYILHGQFWRLITWVMIPPSTGIFWAIIMMMLYYQLGQTLERTWGTFRFNVYIFGGILFTIIGAFLLYAFYYFVFGVGISLGMSVSTYYINMGIFLAFATCFPDMQVMLYFIIPIKMKWMAVVYALFMVYDAINSGWGARVVMLMSLLNFIIFYFSTRNFKRINPKEIKRKKQFQAQMHRPQGNYTAANGTITKHKCAICGRTELDDPALEFRFCSKCEGNYEYCQDHLFTHEHRRRS